MTGLKDTLTRHADDVADLPLDLDAVLADGARRVRRRRLVGVGAAAALALVVGSAAVWALPGGTDRSTTPDVASQDWHPGEVAYAVDSVIHQGDATLDVGFPVKSMVETSAGWVLGDDRGRVYAVSDGDPLLIGSGATPTVDSAASIARLRVASDGGLVAWVETTGRGSSVLAWFNPATEVVNRTELTPQATDGTPRLIAVDGRTVWVDDGRGLVSVDATGDTVVADAGRTVIDVSAGVFLRDVSAARPRMVAGDLAASGPVITNAQNGRLSPDGRHVLSDDGDQAVIFDVRTSDRVDLTAPDYDFLAPYLWLDNAHVATVGLPTTDSDYSGPITLLTCAIDGSGCTVEDTITSGYVGANLPTGDPLG